MARGVYRREPPQQAYRPRRRLIPSKSAASSTALPDAVVVTVTASNPSSSSATAFPGAVVVTAIVSSPSASGPAAAVVAPTAITSAELLAGTVTLRQEGIRWDLYDADGTRLGTLAVDRSHVPRITNDVNRPIRRTVDGMIIPPRPVGDVDATLFYAEDINPLTMQIRPVWLLQTGDAYPLGTFLWGDDSTTVFSWGGPRQATLVDQCSILAQSLDLHVGYPVGTVISDALIAQAAIAGFGSDAVIIEATTTALAAPAAWAVGRDTRLTVLESLCALAGYLPPYFNNNGLLVCRSAPNLETAAPSFTYGTNTVVLNGSIIQSSDILSAPNRYVAIDTSATESELVGVFDIPDAAPHSYANRHRRIVKTVEIQGLADQIAADDAAAAAYASDSSTYAWLSFDTPPDPRHDTFDVLAFEGTHYRQQAWTLECSAGGRMNHDCRGTYN